MKKPKKPDYCTICKGKEFWWRESQYGNGWLCAQCHPPCGLDKDNRSPIGAADDG